MSDHQHIVIDVPESLSPEQAAASLNAPGECFMLVTVLPVPGGHRAFFRQYKQKPVSKAEAVEAAKDDATALSILRANRNQSVRTIVDLLGKAGIKRGKQWVCDQLEATCAEDGREEEARSIVERKCLFYEDAASVVAVLKWAKIKRSVAWARRTRDEFRKATGWTAEKQKEHDRQAQENLNAVLAKHGVAVRK
jgi:hypothetical protein